MNNSDIERSLESMKLLVDTREQPTGRYKKRIEQIGLPFERRKLNYGDYSCECILPDVPLAESKRKKRKTGAEDKKGKGKK